MLKRVHACLCKHLRWLGLLGRVEYSHVHEPETAPTARHTACVSELECPRATMGSACYNGERMLQRLDRTQWSAAQVRGRCCRCTWCSAACRLRV